MFVVIIIETHHNEQDSYSQIEKVIGLFNTREEAEEYRNNLELNQWPYVITQEATIERVIPITK